MRKGTRISRTYGIGHYSQTFYGTVVELLPENAVSVVWDNNPERPAESIAWGSLEIVAQSCSIRQALSLERPVYAQLTKGGTL